MKDESMDDKSSAPSHQKQMSLQIRAGHDGQALMDIMQDLPKNMTEAGNQLSRDDNSEYASVSKGVTVDQSFRKQIEDSRFNRTTGKKFLESTHRNEYSDLGTGKQDEERGSEATELTEQLKME